MSYTISSFSASCFGASNAQFDFWVGRKWMGGDWHAPCAYKTNCSSRNEQHFVSSVVFDGQLLGKLPDSIHYIPFFMCSSYNVAQMFSTRIEYLEVLWLIYDHWSISDQMSWCGSVPLY